MFEVKLDDLRHLLILKPGNNICHMNPFYLILNLGNLSYFQYKTNNEIVILNYLWFR